MSLFAAVITFVHKIKLWEGLLLGKCNKLMNLVGEKIAVATIFRNMSKFDYTEKIMSPHSKEMTWWTILQPIIGIKE